MSVAETQPPADQPEVQVPAEAPDTLVVEDITEGTGAGVGAHDRVRVDYVGVSQSTGEQFDSSYVRGEAAEFSLDGVISVENPSPALTVDGVAIPDPSNRATESSIKVGWSLVDVVADEGLPVGAALPLAVRDSIRDQSADQAARTSPEARIQVCEFRDRGIRQ